MTPNIDDQPQLLLLMLLMLLVLLLIIFMFRLLRCAEATSRCASTRRGARCWSAAESPPAAHASLPLTWTQVSGAANVLLLLLLLLVACRLLNRRGDGREDAVDSVRWGTWEHGYTDAHC